MKEPNSTIKTWKPTPIPLPTIMIVNKLAATNLSYNSADHNTYEKGISENSFEHIPLAVDFSGVDFVETLHQYKNVEHHCEVVAGLPGFAVVAPIAVFEREKLVTRKQNSVEND